MHRLQFHYTLTPDSGPALVRNPLMDLLQAVALNGSIAAAARALGLSYRHVWGELKRWETVLGLALIIWDKGQSARLTDGAVRLLAAERQAQARLGAQIEALRGELERSFAMALVDTAPVLTLYASHDDALISLREHALHHSDRPLHLDIQFAGSVDALRALDEGRCVMAGFHTATSLTRGSLTERTCRPLLQPERHSIIGFAQRTQGLMVAPGNPLGIQSLPDLQRTGARFANRALGSGTRLWLDDSLAQAGLRAAEIQGYDRTEPSHTAVAQAVACGSADAGLGTELAAQSRSLDFIPLVTENYHLVCLTSALEQPGVAALRILLQSPQWQHALAGLAGHQPAHCGTVLALDQVLHWWHIKNKKRHQPT